MIKERLDFVLTHCASTDTTTLLSQEKDREDVLTDYLQEIKKKLTYKKWYFGHHHMEAVFDREYCLYEQIVRIQ